MAVIASLITFALLELGARLLLLPDERGYGTLMGIVLPPYNIVTPAQVDATDRKNSYRDIVVDGRGITIGDVSGYHRFDATLGYTHMENAKSVNGWWQSNNIGAREVEPTLSAAAAKQNRWLLFGESFAHGSGLPAEQGWAYVIENASASLDVVNLAVDGYGMAQAFLRYQSLADRLEHHGVMMMFVPDVDLWRDVNTLRTLGEPWKVQAVMPRFVLEGESLQLVPSPYSRAGELFQDNKQGLGPDLREHLRRYDRFYFPSEHASNPLLDHFITFKVAIAAYGRYARGAVRRALRESGSEALEVSRGIFDELHRSTEIRGTKFVLLVLPTANDLRRLNEDRDYQAQWTQLVQFVCAGPWRCTDLSQALRLLAQDEIDAGPDGNHYGPKMNRHIASAVIAAIEG